MKNRLAVVRGKDCWEAKHSGPWAEEVKALFGVCTIPTPYSTNTPKAKVIARLEQLNPGVIVE